MPRMSKEAKAESRKRIVTEAARLYRANGIEATSVGDVMAAAGLTHGGFYRHFRSKDELVEAAVASASKTRAEQFHSEIETFGPARALLHFVKRYLSEEHVNNPGNGCPVAALTAEASHGPALHSAAVTTAAEVLTNIIAACLKPAPDAEIRAAGILATLVGAVAMARALPPGPRREHVLKAARTMVAV